MSELRNVVIRASAGTGKTFQLSNRYLQLLHAGVPPDEILATTFTRKAAAEIQDRVMFRLAEAALDEKAAAKLSDELGIASLTKGGCRDLLIGLLRRLHRIRISTLDSFFAQIARSFSLDMRLPPGWRIVEDVQDAAYRDEAIQKLLRAGSVRDIQRLVRLMAQGNATRSISEMIRQTVEGLHNLYLATEADAWLRFPSYPKLTMPELAEVIQVLRDFPFDDSSRMEVARDKDATSAELGDWEALLKGGLAAKVLDGSNSYYKKPIPAPAVELYQRLIGHARALMVEQLRHQTEASYKLLRRFNEIYERLKYAGRVLGFADVTRAVAHATLDNVDRMNFRLDACIAHLLLDEFQDTSLDQWYVLRPFAQRVVAHATGRATGEDRTSLFCVGDSKQAIYGWRGGVPEIFDAVEKELPGLKLEPLNCSHRSSQPVIDAVNELFANLTNHTNLDKTQAAAAKWQGQFPHHKTAKTELPGYVELVTTPEKTNDQKQADVTLAAAADRVAELNRLAPAATIGVLVRTNKTVGRLIYELRQRNVHASEEGGNPLTDSAAVQLVLSLLQLADHPGDTIARFHIAQSPLTTVLGLTSHDDADAARRLAANVRRRVQDEGYGPVISDWAKYLAASCSRRDASRLQQLIDLAFGYQPMATLRTQHFVKYVETLRVADPLAANVQVMTIHKSKGLQFDIVVLPELEADLVGQHDSFVVHQPEPTEPIERVCLYRNAQIQALLPDDMRAMFADATDRSVTESLCVLYVAVTRAVHALCMIIDPSKSKTMPRKFSGLLRAALHGTGPVAAQTVLYRHGDPQWYDKDHSPQLTHREVEEGVAAPLHVELAPRDDAGTADESVSPSALAGGTRRLVGDVLNLDMAPALSRGTLVHTWFELVGWLDDGRPVDDALRRIAQRYDTSGLNVDELIDAFNQMLDRPAVADLLSKRCYHSAADSSLGSVIPEGIDSERLGLEVLPERTFAVHEDGRLVFGAIDRLVLLYDGDRLVAADVIDFKTDEVPAGDADAVDTKVRHYSPQLNAYRTAVAKTYRLAPQQIAARLAFVSAGIVADAVD
jgi:ATP-dependent exoDNAse (exonuclease V) beta subunit